MRREEKRREESEKSERIEQGRGILKEREGEIIFKFITIQENGIRSYSFRNMKIKIKTKRSLCVSRSYLTYISYVIQSILT